LAEHCAEFGRSLDDISVSNPVMYVRADEPSRRDRVIDLAAKSTGTPREEAAECVLTGSVDEIAARVRAFEGAGVAELFLFQPRADIRSLLHFDEHVIASWT